MPTLRPRAPWSSSSAGREWEWAGGSGSDQLAKISHDMGVFIGRKRVGATGSPTAT